MNEVVVQYCVDVGYPVVSVDFWTTNPRADAVVADCFSEGQIAADFLLRQGHKQIFYVGNLLGHRDGFQREADSERFLAGVQRALVLAGRPSMPDAMVRFSGQNDQWVGDTTDWYLSLRPRPDSRSCFRLHPGCRADPALYSARPSMPGGGFPDHGDMRRRCNQHDLPADLRTADGPDSDGRPDRPGYRSTNECGQTGGPKCPGAWSDCSPTGVVPAARGRSALHHHQILAWL